MLGGTHVDDNIIGYYLFTMECTLNLFGLTTNPIWRIKIDSLEAVSKIEMFTAQVKKKTSLSFQ